MILVPVRKVSAWKCLLVNYGFGLFSVRIFALATGLLLLPGSCWWSGRTLWSMLLKSINLMTLAWKTALLHRGEKIINSSKCTSRKSWVRNYFSLCVCQNNFFHACQTQSPSIPVSCIRLCIHILRCCVPIEQVAD